MLNKEEARVGGGVVVVTAATVTAVAVSQHDALAPILAFVGVMLVALLTAYFAKRRQDDQLAAEAERQRAQLDAERDRLEQQHTHERRLADTADLRAVLADALVAGYRAREAILLNRYGAYDAEVRSRSEQAITEMESQLAKLHIRVGKDDPIVEAFEKMGDVTHVLHRSRTRGEPVADDDPTLLIWGERYKTYIQLAQGRAGSRDH